MRRRPVASYTRSDTLPEVSTHSPRRIVVTRVRPRGPAHTSGYGNELPNGEFHLSVNGRQKEVYSSEFGSQYSDPSEFERSKDKSDFGRPKYSQSFEFDGPIQLSEFGRHKVTITRRRKIIPSTTSAFHRERLTRKKLVSVRPIPQPSPTLAIITTGFFTAPSDDDEEYSDEEEESPNDGNRNFYTPKLQETPNTIENKPLNNKDLLEASKIYDATMSDISTPIIITDNFFFPISPDDDVSYDDNSDDDDDKEKDGPYKFDTKVKDDDKNRENSKTKGDDKGEEGVEIEDDTKAKDSDKVSEEKNVDNYSVKENVKDSDDSIDKDVTKEGGDAEDKDVASRPKSDGKKDEDTKDKDGKEDNVSKSKLTDDIIDDRYTTKLDEVTTETPFDEDLYLTTKESISESVTENYAKEVLPVTTESSQWDDITSNTESPTTLTPPKVTESIPTKKSNASTEEIRSNIPIIEPFRPTSASNTSFVDKSKSSIEGPLKEDSLTVKPLETFIHATPSIKQEQTSSIDLSPQTETGYFTDFDDDADIPSVIPLDTEYILENSQITNPSIESSRPIAHVTTTFTSPTPEDIEAGLADDLYLSLSRPDFPQILPSKPIFDSVLPTSGHSGSVFSTPELKTSVYYTETIVTSTRLRTYTYVVTKLNGLETEVTSSTTVRPRVTTLTLTVPITVTVTPTAELTSSLATSDKNPEITIGEYPFHKPGAAR